MAAPKNSRPPSGWGDPGSPDPTASNRGGRPRRVRLPRWRIFTWVILAFNLIMLIWIIAGVSSNARNCSGLTGDALTNCEAGNVGTGIGATLIFVLWALGDVILGVLWLVTRPRTRDCPVCGNSVRRGMTQCRNCGYDFTQQLRPPSPAAGWTRDADAPQPPVHPPGENPDPRGR